MSRHRRTLLVASVALAPLVVGGFLLQERATRDGARLFDQVMSLVSDRFVDTLGTGALYERAAQGLVKQLNDPYSELLTPAQLKRFSQTTNGRYGGVGMQIEDQQGRITVSRVFPHTPAENGGVAEGDRIVGVDTQSTAGWTIQQVSDALLGTPGTKVTVKFLRPGVGDTIISRFTRAIVHIPAVPYATMMRGNIGYIPVQGFNETTSSEVSDALTRLSRQGAKGFVIDLRDNGGGILDQAITMSNLFLKQGQEILAVRGRGPRADVYVAEDRPAQPSVPLVILTNDATASASEIVAGALQDHDRALIVGTTSFGKGLVQTLYNLDGGYALKITTAKWYTPSGRSIQKERKFENGRFVEEAPDSLETDTVKKARPAYKSDAGRTVYGGGGITPDVIVPDDTLSAVEQRFVKALAPKIQQSYAVLNEYALSLKPGLTPSFTAQPAWRDEFYRRLTAAGVEIDRALYDSAGTYVTRTIEHRVARLAFGDSTAKKRDLPWDSQLRRALELLERGSTQRDLFALAQQQTAALPAGKR